MAKHIWFLMMILSFFSTFAFALANKTAPKAPAPPIQTTIFPPLSHSIKVVIYHAEWCVACKVLEEDLKQAGYEHSIPIQVIGKTVLIPIEIIQVASQVGSVDDLKKIGMLTTSLPEIHILEQNQLISVMVGYDSRTLTFMLHKLEETAQPAFEGASQDKSITAKAFHPSAVIIVGTGSEKKENPFWVGSNIKQIKSILNNELHVQQNAILTLYGNPGDKEDCTADFECTFSVNTNQHDNRYTFVSKVPPYDTKVDGVNADAPFTKSNLKAAFQTASSQKSANALVIMVGHGNKNGVNYWGQDGTLNPYHLSKLAKTYGGQTVLVSGNCYGGQFALSASCGFFAADPKHEAAVCLSADNQSMDDYSSIFFDSLKKDNFDQADLNHDGKISFEEAHWFAFQNANPQDVPYTSLDALADDFFSKHEDSLPPLLTFSQIKKFTKNASLGEKGTIHSLLTTAVRELKAGETLATQTICPLTGSKSIVSSNEYFEIGFDLNFEDGGNGRVGINKLKFSEVSLAKLRDLGLEEIKKQNQSGRNFLIHKLTVAVEPKGEDRWAVTPRILLKEKKKNETSGEIEIVDVPEDQSILLPAIELTDKQLNALNEKNPLSNDTDYKKMKRLVRRLYFKQTIDEFTKLDPSIAIRLQEIQTCESQDIAAFLGGTPTSNLTP